MWRCMQVRKGNKKPATWFQDSSSSCFQRCCPCVALPCKMAVWEMFEAVVQSCTEIDGLKHGDRYRESGVKAEW